MIREILWGALAGAVVAAPAVARADDGADLLDGSAHAVIVGPTLIADPELIPGYMPTIDLLYLNPLGFNGTPESLEALITPETPFFGPSIAEGEQILIQAVEADYNAGDLSAADPLTIDVYSQSTVIASLAEPVLYDYGIPSDDLRFVMEGDAAADPTSGPTGILDTFAETPLGKDFMALMGWSYLDGTETPNDLYPTDVFTVPDDFWADFSAGHPILGFLDHGDYMGVSEQAIQAAMNDASTTTVDGLTNYYTIDPGPLLQTLVDTALNDIGLHTWETALNTFLGSL